MLRALWLEGVLLAAYFVILFIVLFRVRNEGARLGVYVIGGLFAAFIVYQIVTYRAISTTPTVTPTPTPKAIGVATACYPGSAVAAPCTSGAVVGQPYKYILYVHCGVRQAYFDGRWWVPSPPPGGDNVSPPAGWGNPQDSGTIVLTADDMASFKSSTGTTVGFSPAPSTFQPEGCD